MAAQAPPAAQRNYRVSSLLAGRAVTEAQAVRPAGITAIWRTVFSHQVANAQTSQMAVAQMLVEQEIDVEADALLNSLAFTTELDSFEKMLDQVQDEFAFDRLVESMVQDAGRAAESVAVAARPRTYHVRFVNLPCCTRCAILAGRVYPWSSGFKRHPGCDCTMIPTTVASPLWQDPMTLVEQGHVTGLSRYDRQALEDGADLNRVVNVRLKKAGLLEAGHAITRAGKPTPAAIYRAANGDREDAIRRLKAAGYFL